LDVDVDLDMDVDVRGLDTNGRTGMDGERRWRKDTNAGLWTEKCRKVRK